ncbi:MAG: TIGR03545 family protein [Candidatus Tenebribacter burtonii]|nr:TIGR03545 family protein [Candidatus Tenebribacter burtonii]
MLRKKGLGSLVIIAIVIVVLSIIFSDLWLEKRLEKIGSSIVGAKVEFDNLDLSLIGMHLKWKRLQITDPNQTMKNMIETGKCELDLEFLPLLSKKVIIENIELSDLRTGTQRESDGYFKKEKLLRKDNFVSKTMEHLENEIKGAPAFNLEDYSQKVNVDSVLAILNLQSPERIDSLKEDLNKKYNDWQTRLAGLEIEKDAKKLEAEIETLDVKQVKTVESMQNALQSLDTIKKSVNTLSNSVTGTKQELTSDLSLMKNSLSDVDNWIKADYTRGLSLAKLPDFNTQNIAKLIFGKKIVNQVNTYLNYVSTARHYAGKFKSDEPKKERTPRLKGQDIYFYTKNARPDFWIKQIKLSGQTPDKLILAGDIHHIVSDQHIIGETTDFNVGGSTKAGLSLSANGELNYLHEEPQETFTLQYSNFSLKNVKLSDSELFPQKINNGFGDMEANLNLIGDKIAGKIGFAGKNLTFDLEETGKAKTKFEEIIQDVIQNTNEIRFTAEIKGERDNLNFSLKSNLDELLVKNLKASLGKELEQAKQRIRGKVDEEVNKKRSELEEFITGKDKQLLAEIDKYEEILNEQLKLVNDKIVEINKGKLGGGVKNKLKGLFQ